MLKGKDGWLKITGQGFWGGKKRETKKHIFCGTPQYLVPEVINNEEYNFSVDLWAAETLIFKMVVGYPPILATELMRVYERTVDWRFNCHHFSKG
jgi:serine/threonine protein kinase